MSVLIVAATAREIAPFVSRLTRSSFKIPVEVLITGVGTINATYALMKQVSIKRPSLLIQAGLAGCFDQHIPLGSVVVVERDRLGDLGVVEQGKLLSVYELGLGEGDQFPYKKGWLQNTHTVLIKRIGVQKVRAITVNQVTTSNELHKLLLKKYQPVTESLEGAAFHYVALREKIPFLQLRGISNYIGERDKKKWKLKEAIRTLNRELVKIINNY